MLTITNNNIYFSDVLFSDLESVDDAEKIHPKSIINFLSDTVELSETLTIKRLFDIAALNVGAFNEIFYTSLGGYPIEPYLQEIENNQTDTTELDYLEVYWLCDRYDNELNICSSLHGVSYNDTDTYALDFVSLNNIKNQIIKLNKSVFIQEYNEVINNIDIVDDSLGDMSFTLFDLYNAIFTEISFHGGPQDKKERFEDIQESILESEDGINEPTSYLSFEEMIERYESSDIYLVKYDELRDRVDANRMLIDKNLDKLKTCLLEKLKIYDVILKTDKNLHKYYKKLTDLEYSLQLLYGEKEDLSYHRFWETPKCSCPRIDNIEIYPSKKPIFDTKCPIHGKKLPKNKKTS